METRVKSKEQVFRNSQNQIQRPGSVDIISSNGDLVLFHIDSPLRQTFMPFSIAEMETCFHLVIFCCAKKD